MQVQFFRERLESGTLGTVSRDDERNVWQARHGLQEFIDALLRREPSEVEQIPFIGGQPFGVRQSLEVGQDFNALRGETALDQLVAHEFAGSQEHLHTTFVGPQPFVQVGLGGKNRRAGTRPGVATLCGSVVKSAVTAEFASAAIGDKIVGGAQDLEIVQVVEHGDPLALQFPKNRGRQVVVDAANVRQIGREVSQTTAHRAPSRWGIEGMRRHLNLLQETSVWILEVDTRNAITAAGERGSTAVVHAEQRRFLAALIHLVDEVEEVRFGAAKRIVVLVAIEDAHGYLPVGKRGPGIDRQKRADFAGDYRKRRCWPRPPAGFRPEKLCWLESN